MRSRSLPLLLSVLALSLAVGSAVVQLEQHDRGRSVMLDQAQVAELDRDGLRSSGPVITAYPTPIPRQPLIISAGFPSPGPALTATTLGAEHWIGELVSSGASVNNATTAVPFTLPGLLSGRPSHLALSCTALVHYKTGTDSSTAAITKDAPVPGGQTLFDVWTGRADLAILPDTGSATCEVYRAIGPTDI